MCTTTRASILIIIALLLTFSGLATTSANPRAGDETPPVTTNDNRHPSGTLMQRTLTLHLRAAVGSWHPEGPSGPAIQIEAFGEEGGPLQAPAPLVRVAEGTDVVASVRNGLATSLRVHGLCARDGSPCPPIDVPAAESREVRFTASRAGTYSYWATSTGMPLPFRGAMDTQLSGALIVDRSDAAPNQDRVLVITDWTSMTTAQLLRVAAADDPGKAVLALDPRIGSLINGLSWPATERLTYRVGDEVRWRVINLSSQRHPMHLHGFYFDVDSIGDGQRDTAFDEPRRPRVVTQLLNPGATMTMRWRPERAGNWLFHCHVALHIAPERRFAAPPAGHHTHHGSAESEAGMAGGMAGMVMGITVLPASSPKVPADTHGSAPSTVLWPRTLTLVMRTEAQRFGTAPAFGFVLAEHGDSPATSHVPVPGPTLTLRRDEPVEITLINRLPEATAVHWHGIELDSYYDGVHGWSGGGEHVTPLIEPGTSFVVRFTPPRAGTFMYHTHMHDDHQLGSGMYGALLVTAPGDTWDPTIDHVLVLGQDGPGGRPGQNMPLVVNGSREPQLIWKAGTRHRLRFINITANEISVVSLSSSSGPAAWRPVAKDGAALPVEAGVEQPASQTIAVGETFDFEFDAPPGRRTYWLEVRTPAGRWQAQGLVTVR